MPITDYLLERRSRWIEIVSDFCRQKKTEDFLTAYLVTGGKWHRPTLAEIGYRLAGGKDIISAEKAFASLELIHRYLLVHDDIVDQDLIRHGLPTLEQHFKLVFDERFPGKKDETYSKGMAMIAGDVIGAYAYDLLNQSQLAAQVLSRATVAMSQLLVETAAGWEIQTEQNFMEIEQVSEADFVRGMELVSAKYSFIWPMRIGQILAGKNKDNLDINLDRYAYHVGIAFQIRDDYLGMFGDEQTTGKPVGHDYREGKKTLYILRTYGKLGGKDRNFLQETLGHHPSDLDIAKAKRLMQETGAVDEIKKLGESHVVQAKEYLEKIDDDSDLVKLLNELADLMITRLH